MQALACLSWMTKISFLNFGGNIIMSTITVFAGEKSCDTEVVTMPTFGMVRERRRLASMPLNGNGFDLVVTGDGGCMATITFQEAVNAFCYHKTDCSPHGKVRGDIISITFGAPPNKVWLEPRDGGIIAIFEE